jgi:hypothetical protein
MEWTEEQAVERLLQLADAGGETDADKRRALAELVVREVMEYCHLALLPEGALWAAAQELERRCGSLQAVQRVAVGDFSVQYAGEDWKRQLGRWRKMVF